ncbi:MAG: amidase, partial [Proteobacteria bacterium]|nr:amidase [Pseudomonadota bacterium]
MHEILKCSMIEQARLVKTGKVSPRELLEAAIERIEAVNPQLNAVVLPMYALAEKALSELKGSEPYAGVPMLLKDVLAEYAGSPMTEGSRFLQGYVSSRDSELVRRYRTAGFIVCGKTNSPEFASMPTTEPELYGPTKNPWDLSRSPGGSSGGSAAAVASGMVSVAHANDGG